MKLISRKAACSVQCRQFRASRKGSTLVLVLLLTTALILLGSALLPLALTTGSETVNMEKRYENYLLSRSAMEYAKGELACLVQSEQPCTFAVLRDGSGFRAVRKLDGGISINHEYAACIDFDPLGRSDDAQDQPKDSAAGRQVVAICAAVPTGEPNQPYEITVRSFIAAEPCITCEMTIKEEVIK